MRCVIARQYPKLHRRQGRSLQGCTLKGANAIGPSGDSSLRGQVHGCASTWRMQHSSTARRPLAPTLHTCKPRHSALSFHQDDPTMGGCLSSAISLRRSRTAKPTIETCLVHDKPSQYSPGECSGYASRVDATVGFAWPCRAPSSLSLNPASWIRLAVDREQQVGARPQPIMPSRTSTPTPSCGATAA